MSIIEQSKKYWISYIRRYDSQKFIDKTFEGIEFLNDKISQYHIEEREYLDRIKYLEKKLDIEKNKGIYGENPEVMTLFIKVITLEDKTIQKYIPILHYSIKTNEYKESKFIFVTANEYETVVFERRYYNHIYYKIEGVHKEILELQDNQMIVFFYTWKEVKKMHVNVLNIILGVIFFVLMSIAEVVHYFAKKDMELSDLLKKLGLYALVGVFITLFTTL